ncbi:MAG: DEAD/DEAH box helicase [Thaumarchaeota archaeon]|nr:DEAD/DEAH box helicase [Nitrososphaerota archaeon]
MQRYRCPECSQKLSLERLYDGRYLIRCNKCHLTHIVRPDINSLDEAYLKLLEEFDEDRVKKIASLEQLLEVEGIRRSKTSVEKLVKDGGGNLQDLPQPMKDALLSQQDYPALYRRIPAEEPDPGVKKKQLPIDEAIWAGLATEDVTHLYRFQEKAVEAIIGGKDVVIVAPTGSGKTEAFAIPVIQLISNQTSRFGALRTGERAVRALFVYPTKALARDQLPKLRKLAGSIGVRIDVFDGDTSQSDRYRIIEDPPDIVITNFDTLHHHFIHRTKFARLLRTVKYLVVDEIHVYTGTFGSNIYFVLKRLERLCGGLQIAAASATIGNPKEFCEDLFGRKFVVIEGGRGKRGVIHLAMIFPTLRSHRALTLDLLKHLVESGRRTIVFSNSHLSAELTAFYGRRNGIPIEVHRAGLTQKWRVGVEERFKNGSLKAISSTPTLELGIDIGSVDSIISDLVTWTRLIQRTGRAGRRGQESLVFISLRESDPISQYYKNNPEDYFKDIEPGYIDPTNPVISRYQLLAAAIDQPIRAGEFSKFQETLDEMVKSNLLSKTARGLIPDYSAARRTLQGYDIRGAGETVSVMFGDRKVGERSMPQALDELHPGAVYFLGGARYLSKNITFYRHEGRAEVERLPSNYPYYTRSLKEEWPSIRQVYSKKQVMGLEVAYCDLLIQRKVSGYTTIEIGSEVASGERVMLAEPVKYTFRTKGIVFKAPVPENILLQNSEPKKTPDELAASSFHATEHVTIEGTNMITGGAATDMGGVAMGNSGLIFIYDSSAGGNGATRLLYDRLEEAVKRGLTILKECPCSSEDGCPRCTYSYRCGNNNEYLSKYGATEVFQRILDGEPTSISEPIEGDKSLV